MTIDANLFFGIQVGFVLGMVCGVAVTVVGVRVVWRQQLAEWRGMRSAARGRRGGYAAEEQE